LCPPQLKVPTTDNPANTVNFRKLLLNRCQKEFEKDQDDDVIFEKKQKELEASKDVRKRRRPSHSQNNLDPVNSCPSHRRVLVDKVFLGRRGKRLHIVKIGSTYMAGLCTLGEGIYF